MKVTGGACVIGTAKYFAYVCKLAIKGRRS
jgi:hypothetical protein